MHVQATAGGLALLLAILAGGCSASPTQIEIPALRARIDAGPLAGDAPPPGAVLCDSAEPCDDGVACTVDLCGSGGYCQHFVDNGACSDGNFCNGVEICNPTSGCLPPPRIETCDDRDVCTLDACDNERQMCVHSPRDSDGDGEVDWHCPGGTDCDDFKPKVGARRAELCLDGIDNDCDGTVDESDCGRPPHDTCADAFELSAADLAAGTTREISSAGAARDYVLSCGAQTSQDVVFTFSIDTASDVDITAWGILPGGDMETATVALRSDDCADSIADVDCGVGFPAHVRSRALPAGRYYIIVDCSGAESIALSASVADASASPSNQTCADPEPINELAGVRYAAAGNFVDVSDDYGAVCAQAAGESPSQPDLVYRYSLSEERDVSVSLSSLSGEQMTFSVRTACEDPDSTLTCRIAAPATSRMHRQPPGDYFLIIESPSYREVDYALEVIFDPPSDPPVGDSCDVVEDLPIGPAVAGSLLGKQPAVSASCHEDFLAPDAVYRFVIDKPMDLTLEVDGDGATMRMAVQQTCGDSTSELRCLAGSPTSVRLRNLQPGEYFVTVDAPEPVGFSIQATAEDLTIPTRVADNNEVCANAVTIPDSGGLFAGDTSAMGNDYQACANADLPDAVYRLELVEESRVSLHLDADFDAVLYRFGAACGGAVLGCNDDDPRGGTGASYLDEVVSPGVHHYVVDGRSGDSGGPYTLEVVVRN